MALTNDEIKKILELDSKRYSGRKISRETGNSETTIRKVIQQAKKTNH